MLPRRPSLRRLCRRSLLPYALASCLILTAACAGDRLELARVVERTTLELAAPTSEEVVEQPRVVGTTG